jgi:hypothetical protein
MMGKLALFSGKDCPQLALLKQILAEKGVAPYAFDMRLGGEGAPVVSFDDTSFRWDGCDLSEVSAVYIRCTTPNTPPSPPPVLNAASYCEYRAEFLREQEFSAATHGFFAALAAAGKLVINELRTYADHDTKAQLYEKLRAQQFPVPATLTTSDPERAREFLARHPEVVAKPSAGVGSTRLFTEEDRERLELLRICPVMMQERIRGHTLRVNIVGDSVVLAIRIVGSGETVDSRTAPRGFEAVKLPDAEEARMVRANRALGLHYSAWDIIESHDGRYVYLDCNPGPYILWTGPKFSRAVLEQLAEYMIGFAQTGSVTEASARVRPYAHTTGGPRHGSAAARLARRAPPSTTALARGNSNAAGRDDFPGRSRSAAAARVDAILADIAEGGDIAAQRKRLERSGALSVRRLVEHLRGDWRKYALYGLQYCWSAAALEPVAELLTDRDLDTRRMAAILLDRHMGREYLAQRCAAHVLHSDPQVAGFCFEHSELMFPDVERARALFVHPHLHWRLARRLPRYYARTLASGTLALASDQRADVARGALAALIHHGDRRAEEHELVRARLASDQPTLREAAAEYLAWHGGTEDLRLLSAQVEGEPDAFARASQLDAIAAIRRRSAARREIRPLSTLDEVPPTGVAAAYREALQRLEADPGEASDAHARIVCATAEPFEPRLFYVGVDPAPEFALARRLRERLLAHLVAMPWCDSIDAEEAPASEAPRLARAIVAPTRSCFAADGESFGVHTKADDRAFKSVVHVGDDVSWQEDHAAVLALADGVVRSVRCQSSWGYLVIVEHALERTLRPGLAERAAKFAATTEEPVVGPDGEIRLCSLYAHLGAFVRVRPGEHVTAGQKLGVIGRTFTWENGGYPAHLHLGLHFGPFVQTPRAGTLIDTSYQGKRYRGRVVRTTPRGIETTIRHRDDPKFTVLRTRSWECGYISRWYWDGAAHGWLSALELLRPPSG